MLQAAELGLWGAARLLFESGLERRPQHTLMAEKLATALAASCDWPAAQDCLFSLKKSALLSKHAILLSRQLSEHGCSASADDSDAQYLTGSFKRRRIQAGDIEASADVPAKLELPASDWLQLLDALMRCLESHIAGGSASRYMISIDTNTSAASCKAFPDDPQAAHDRINQQQLLQTSVAEKEEDTGIRPQSAGAAVVQEAAERAATSAAEQTSQECTERVSERISRRRSDPSEHD